MKYLFNFVLFLFVFSLQKKEEEKKEERNIQKKEGGKKQANAVCWTLFQVMVNSCY